jgi:hypothetical protein
VQAGLSFVPSVPSVPFPPSFPICPLPFARFSFQPQDFCFLFSTFCWSSTPFKTPYGVTCLQHRRPPKHPLPFFPLPSDPPTGSKSYQPRVAPIGATLGNPPTDTNSPTLKGLHSCLHRPKKPRPTRRLAQQRMQLRFASQQPRLLQHHRQVGRCRHQHPAPNPPQPHISAHLAPPKIQLSFSCPATFQSRRSGDRWTHPRVPRRKLE